MDTYTKMLLDDDGWTVECESPLEIRHTDGSIATGRAAAMILAYLRILDQDVPDV